MAKKIEIVCGELNMAVRIMRQLPEFNSPYNLEEINKKVRKKSCLNLIAYIENSPAGFKLGYERDGYFYSWLGGVLPKYRRMGVAKKLADEQEEWAKENGYDSITFKTRNRHKAMLSFSLNNGFNIFKVEEKEIIEEYRIWLKKKL